MTVNQAVDIPRFASTSVAAEVRDTFVGRRTEHVPEIAVCNGDRLLGLVSLERLAAARHDAPLG
jgi:hypothetical protein